MARLAVKPVTGGANPGGFLKPSSESHRRGPGIEYVPRDPKDSRKLAIDWTVVANEYITGVVFEDKAKGEWVRKYPTYDELAAKFGLKRSTIAYQCRAGNWADRRLAFNQQLATEVDAALAKRRAIDVSDIVGTIDDYILKFGKGVKADTVTRATMADLDKAVRLRVHVVSEMRARESGAGIITIEQLQERHSRMRERAETLEAESSGYVPGRTEREAEGAIEQQAQALADSKVAKVEAKADAQGQRAELHLAALGSLRQKLRSKAGEKRASRHRERTQRLSKLDGWGRAMFLTADKRKAAG